MRHSRPIVLTFALALVLTACSSGAASPSASTAPSTEPSVAPSATPAESATPTPVADACATASLPVLTAGTLTIGTDNPAYPPYFQIPSSGAATAPWELGDPTNGQGFEGAFAYALAHQLGFSIEQVTWVVVPFDNAFAPGAKTFDIDINQVSYKPERAETADLTSGYYTVNQSVVALADNALAKETSLAAMKAYKFGAQVGTTSLDTITNTIAPTTDAKVYNTNDDAVAALKAKQIDGLVVDLPTAFFVTAAQVEGSVVVGQFAPPTGADAEHFSVVLAKGSPLTACVDKAINAMRDIGVLDSLQKLWLADKVSAPVILP